MHIVYVNYHGSRSNSAVHIFHLANELVRRGARCTVCVPQDEDFGEIGPANFASIPFSDAGSIAADSSQPTIVHAWTPREVVRKIVERLSGRIGCPYIVHLEDNEDVLLSESLCVPSAKLLRMSETDLDRLVPEHLSHPRRAREFIAKAAGLSCLVDRLLEFKPADRPGCVVWPGYDPERTWQQSKDPDLAAQLGIGPGQSVLAYTGNVHAANRREVASLYIAVAILNRRGLPTRLIRTGTDYQNPLEPEIAPAIRPYAIEMGRVPRDDLPRLLALSDVLVQPGRVDEFNAYRFPSKLPEFLASGKPVVLPNTNIGLHLRDGEQCLLLQSGWATEIADKVESLLRDKERAAKIGRQGREFARTHLQWTHAAERMETLYKQALAGGLRP